LAWYIERHISGLTDMPSLSLISTEAQRQLRLLKETRRRALQKDLADLCEAHWRELRGPQPATPLAQALWSITPSWSDLLLDLHASGDARLIDLLPQSRLAKGLALLVAAEIERGNETGVYIAHEPMMAFERTPPPADWLARIASLLRGALEPPVRHRHDSREPLGKALAVIAAHTRRLDLPAVLEVIGLLTAPQDQAADARDETLETLRDAVLDAGVRFLGIESERVLFLQHGHEHKPVRTRRLGEMLMAIRRKWLH
jgi:hypothetical protein